MRRAVPLLIIVGCLGGCAPPVRPALEEFPRHCPVHQRTLRGDTVPILYGIPGEIDLPGYREGRQNRFPYANTHQFGGCVRAWDSPTLARTRYCSDCRFEYAQWWKEVQPAITAKFGGAPPQP